MNKTIQRALVAVTSLGVSGLALAAEGDPDLTKVTAAATTVAAVGGAVFAVYIGIRLFKWARSAL